MAKFSSPTSEMLTMWFWKKKTGNDIPLADPHFHSEKQPFHNENDQDIEFLKNRIQLLEKENYRLKENLTTIQSNLADSVGTSQNAISSIHTVSKQFEEVRTESNKILDDVTSLDKIVSDTQASSREIQAIVKSVVDTVMGIEEVVIKTKFLSFNASIEASRAGKAGKGFNVVAQEIKLLSDSTKNLLDTISQKVANFQSISKDLGENSNFALKKTQRIKESMVGFNHFLSETVCTNKETIEGIESTKDEIFMSLAKLDHVIWKINTYISINEEKEAFNFVDHHSCRLGKWYYHGDGFQSFSHLSSYKNLETPHSKVHDGTKKIFDYISNSKEKFHLITEGVKEMENASLQVFACLDDILRGKKNNRQEKIKEIKAEKQAAQARSEHLEDFTEEELKLAS